MISKQYIVCLDREQIICPRTYSSRDLVSRYLFFSSSFTRFLSIHSLLQMLGFSVKCRQIKPVKLRNASSSFS